MNKLISLCLFIVLVVSSISVIEAVVGGTDLSLYEAPWSAAFYVRVGDTGSSIVVDFLSCAATFINERWVMTAFKCVQKGTDPSTPTRHHFKMSQMFVRYGNTSVATGKQLGVMFVALNDDYPDIALLKLSTNVSDFNNFTGPAAPRYVAGPLPGIALDLPVDGEVLSVASFGSNHIDGFGLPDKLQNFSAPYNSSFNCGLTEAEINSTDYLCFGNTAPIQTACAADYGTVLFNRFGIAHAIYLQSNGDQAARSNCRGEGIYSRIDTARDWILNVTSNFTEPANSAISLSFSGLTLICLFIFTLSFY